MSPSLPDYAELCCVSYFSFLKGACSPQELVERAHALGYRALALTDECSMAGAVQAHVSAKRAGLPLLHGAQFVVHASTGTPPPWTLVVIAQTLEGYGNLCEFITRLRRAAPKGTYHLTEALLAGHALQQCIAIVCPHRQATDAQCIEVGKLALTHFTGRCWIGVELPGYLDDERWLERMRMLSGQTALPLVAMGNVHMHVRSRKPLHDVLTAIRTGQPLSQCGKALALNAERHLRSRFRLAQRFPPDLLAQTVVIAAQCHFSLDEIRYQYPDEVIPAGQTATRYLRNVTESGAQLRWPQGIPPHVRTLIERELALIAELGYEHYFLTVFDIVNFARSQNILCQGRGSAANSVVCYCLGITEVDPARMSVLFERFISKERNEPPDIDVDFEHERREEVIQYLYRKYGRDRAALAATVIRYHPRSAIRDAGKALGFDSALIDRVAKDHQWFDDPHALSQQWEALGLNTQAPAIRQWLELTHHLLGIPRHLSQHTGGFVLTRGPLCRLVPIESASMPERTVIEWDKDDLDAAGLLKVDVLALGMLSALRRALDLVSKRRRMPFGLKDIPPEDRATYDMICRADTVGVFQIESRAQMSMLPRLQPRCFYDLVIETAIVRPGPIQGGMVHPYLARRQGKEAVTYPSPDLKVALERTLGIPIFQEQVMQIAMLAAGFTPGEADELRRSMAAWRRKGGLERYYQKIVKGMTSRGYDESFAQAIFEQIKGFSEYGFPESHAASFALLVYASAWIKCHEPAAFLVALLNSQPMGFYSPHQLVQDAQRHGVVVRPVDVQTSHAESHLEDSGTGMTVRLGLHMVQGLHRFTADRIERARASAPFRDMDDLAYRAGLSHAELCLLADADALGTLLEGHRRQQRWHALGWTPMPYLLKGPHPPEIAHSFAPGSAMEEVQSDYAAIGLSLRAHPLALLRPQLQRRGLQTSEKLRQSPDGGWVWAAGLVTLRQRPETAKGTLFLTLEDEFGNTQVIVWPHVQARMRLALLSGRLLAIRGLWQKQGHAANLIASQAKDLSFLLDPELSTPVRNFH